jgi:hypothetical protein
MPAQSYFPVAIWLWRTLTGRRARRAYLALILLVISISAAARFYAFLQTRKIQAELSGLSQVRIDQTSEVELRQVLPSLSKHGHSTNSYYSTEITNETSWLSRWLLGGRGTHYDVRTESLQVRGL